MDLWFSNRGYFYRVLDAMHKMEVNILHALEACIQKFTFNFIRLAREYVTFMKGVVSAPLNLHGTACRKVLKVIIMFSLSLLFAGHETCPQATEKLRVRKYNS
ncbi:hypothetical protein PIB30_059817 [Stylosanthes scabra]|uniref:Uncharacterized protein n=1 Tax=Stylosanthes scabra TaxID=79078 RepID=A0ABU6RKQ6_9FABA|nr:hypothetical protein [Stylosanthes scabra]